MVLQRIQKGDYSAGQRLPSERELAQDLSMSHLAVRRGLQELVDAGLIVRRARVGTFVQKSRPLALSKRMAIVVPYYIQGAHPFMPVLINGTLSGVNAHECDISLFSYRQPEHFWAQAGEPMLARGIKGAIIFTGYMIPRSELEKVEASGIKAVLMHSSNKIVRPAISTIKVDFHNALRETLQRLIDLGHRRIAWMCYTESSFEDIEADLVKEFARRYDLGDPDQIMHRMNCEPSDYDGWDDLLAGDNRPTAVVLQDEFMAHEIFHACRRAGINVPDDLSLVSLADSLPRSHAVPLSAPDTVALWTEATRRAADHVRFLLENVQDRILDVQLHATIQWKASAAQAPQLVVAN